MRVTGKYRWRKLVYPEPETNRKPNLKEIEVLRVGEAIFFWHSAI